MWELYSRKHPFENYPFVVDMEEDIVKGVRPPVFSDCPPEFTSLMVRCWAANPSVRPKAGEVVAELNVCFHFEEYRLTIVDYYRCFNAFSFAHLARAQANLFWERRQDSCAPRKR